MTDSLEDQLRELLKIWEVDDIYETLARIDDPEVGNCPECNGTGQQIVALKPCGYCGGSRNIWWLDSSVSLPKSKTSNEDTET